MSRIEEAIEKARQLQARTGSTPAGNELPQRQALPPVSSPVERISVDNPLLLASNYDMPVAEEYRKLKSIVSQLTKQDGFKNTVMVTSSVAGEGKSITSINLATSLAQEHDYTVLLVDADLRKPSICKYLGLKPETGLANCLLDGMDVGETLIKTGLGNLTILPAGHQVKNPVELFSSRKMKDLLIEIKQRYADRYIIFDTPPVLPFAETRLIGNIIDGVVFVVKEGGISLQNVTEALESLKSSNVLGIVYNQASASSLEGGYHYYYYDYAYKQSSAENDSKGSFISRFRKKKSLSK